jgi:3-deoxy-manno-octulosonate cytidylyltransferase (CMP-KDO synthetase)
LVNPLMIDDLVSVMHKNPDTVMATVIKKSTSREEFLSQDVVKAVVDDRGSVLYFSRSPIPTLLKEGQSFYKHIGLYAFTKEFLFTFKKFPPSYLEKGERLEQLRALENGYGIKAVETTFETIGIDTEADLEKARQILSAQSAD